MRSRALDGSSVPREPMSRTTDAGANPAGDFDGVLCDGMREQDPAGG